MVPVRDAHPSLVPAVRRLGAPVGPPRGLLFHSGVSVALTCRWTKADRHGAGNTRSAAVGVAEDHDLADRRDRRPLDFRAILADNQMLTPLADVGTGFLEVEDRSNHALESINDEFYKFEGIYYNQLLSVLFAGVRVAAATVECVRDPGNSFDRQCEKFRRPFGA
jgi:hypothetical protein